MNFGDILDQWDRDTAKPYGKKKVREDERREKTARSAEGQGEVPARPTRDAPRANPMDVWLRRTGVVDKDAEAERDGGEVSPAERRRSLRSLKSEAILDLHGMTRDEAWTRLEAFFADAVSRSLRKVLIIHGKGSHSADEPVLARTVRTFLERHPRAGESGFSDRESGGHGSTWVILK